VEVKSGVPHSARSPQRVRRRRLHF